MAKLPDIPVESWVSDQVDQLQKKIAGYFPALEFEAASNDAASTIPADFPYPGGQDNWEKAAQQAADEERQRQEQMALEAQQAAQQAEQDRQNQLRQQAWDMASGHGIPTPDQMGSVFQDAVGKPPGTGDDTSTTGAFEQGTQPVQGPPEPRFSMLPQDFNPAPGPPTAADQRGQGVIDTAKQLPSALWDTVSNQLPTAERTGQVLSDAGSAISSIPDKLGQFGDATARTATGIASLAGGAADDLKAGAQGIGTLGSYVYDMGKAAAPAAYQSIVNDNSSDAIDSPDRMTRGMAVADPFTRGLKTAQDAIQSGAAAAGREAGVKYGLTDAPVMKNPITGEPWSALDIAETVGAAVLDPTNYLGGGEAHAAGEASKEALPLAERLAQRAGPSAEEVLLEGGKRALADDPFKVGNLPSAIFDTAGRATRAAGSAVGGAVTDALRPVGEKLRPALDSVDLAAGRGFDALSETAQRAGRWAAENPSNAAGLAGGIYGEATAPEGETPEERAARVGGFAGAAALAVKAKDVPGFEAGAAGFRRGFHGTASEFQHIAENFLRSNSIYGPGYYIASDSRVADTYSQLEAQSQYGRAWRMLDDAKEELTSLHLNNASDEALQAVNDKIAQAREALAATDRSDPTKVGQNTRPAEIDNRANLLRIDGSVTQDDWNRVTGALMRIYGDDPDLGLLAQSYRAEPKPPARMTGDNLYKMLENDFGGIEPTLQENQDIGGNYSGPKAYVNDILSQAGFDGVAYNGGPRDGAYDQTTGRSVPHNTIVIFPDKLDAVRNAFTQEPRAGFLPPGLTVPVAKAGAGAGAGAVSADETDQSDGPPDYTRLATGAGLGALAALGLARIPARGVWKARMEAGLQIPEGLSMAEAGKIEEAFNKAVGLLGASQNEKRAVNRMRFGGQAEKAWDVYEALRARVAGPARRGPAAAKAAEDVTAGPLSEMDAHPFGEPERPVPSAGTDAGTAVPSENLSFEDEALPAQLDPARKLDPEEAGKMIGQLQETLGADPQTRDWMNSQAVRLLEKPKSLTGKNLQTLLDAVGAKRAIARYGPAEEQAVAFRNKFLQDNGWISKVPEDGSTTALSTLAPTGAPAMDTLGKATNVLARGAQMGVQGGVGAGINQEMNPDDPNAALKGFAAGALVPSVARTLVSRGLQTAGKDLPEEAGALSSLGQNLFGVAGNARAKRLESLINADSQLQGQSRVQMFASPAHTSAPSDLRLSEKVHNFWRNKVITGTTDQLGVLQGIQNDVARIYKDQTGQTMPPELLAAEIKRFNSNRAVDMEVQDYLAPHLKKIRELGIPDKDINAYLLNLQDIDIANAQGKVQQVPPGSGFQMHVPNLTRRYPGGQTYADAQVNSQLFENKLQTWMSPQEYQDFQGAVNGIHAFGERVLGYAKDGGLIDEPTYLKLRQDYPRYVPTKIIEKLNDDNFVGRGKSLSINGNTIHELSYQGTDKEAISPIAALLGQAYQAHEAAQKNMVFNSLVDLWAVSAGHHGLAGFTPPDILHAATNSDVENRVARFAEGIKPVAPGTSLPNTENSLTGFRNGVKTELSVPKSLGDLTRFPSPTSIPILSGMMSAFRAGATSRNPVFLTANALLDLSNVLLRESARDGGPQKIPKVLWEWGKAMNEYANPLNPNVWKDLAANEYHGDMAEALRQGGGMSGGHYSTGGLRPQDWGKITLGNSSFDLNGIRNKLGIGQTSPLEDRVYELQRGRFEMHSPQDVANFIKDAALFKWVESYGDRVEQASRLPAYRLEQARGAKRLAVLQDELNKSQAAIAAGGTPGVGPHAGLRSLPTIQDAIDQERLGTNIQAVQNYRTTTLDFDKGGTFTKAINQVIPFFNVGVQSIADIGRAYQEHPVAYTSGALASTLIPMTVAEIWNQHDPQMAKDYADIPDYLKDQGLIFMLPEKIDGHAAFPAFVDKQGNRQPQFFQFRYRQLAPIAMATRYMLQHVLYPQSVSLQDRRSYMDVIDSGLQQLSPVSASNAPDAFMGVLPPALSTAGQVIMDKDTFHGDRRINTTYANERATPLSHALSAAADYVPGTNGWLTPARAEFITRDLGSGLAGAYHGASQIPGQLRGEEPTTYQNAPLVGGLVGRWVKNSIGGQAQDAEAQTVTPSADSLLRKNGVRWRPSAAAPAIRNIPLTRSEYAAYQNQLNQETDETIQEFFRDPEVQTLTSTDKEAALSRRIARVRASVEREHLNRIPDNEIDKRLQREIDAGHLTSGGRAP